MCQPLIITKRNCKLLHLFLSTEKRNELIEKLGNKYMNLSSSTQMNTNATNTNTNANNTINTTYTTKSSSTSNERKRSKRMKYIHTYTGTGTTYKYKVHTLHSKYLHIHSACHVVYLARM